MPNDLVVIGKYPKLPIKWDYDESVNITSQVIAKWKTLTEELANELWIARELLSTGGRPKKWNESSTLHSWAGYCRDIGSSKQVVNRWLKRFFPDDTKDLTVESSETLPSNITLLEGDVLEQINSVKDESIDLLLTDPPYGVMDDFQWDAQDLVFLNAWLKAIQPKFKPIYNGFIFCDARMQYDFETIIREYFPLKNRIVWIRKNMSKGRVVKDRFISSYEVIFFIGNRELNLPKEWGAERFDSCEFAVPQTNFGDKKVHPTQKPLDLIKRLLALGSFPKDTILDCFAGSGTTGLACQELNNRECILIEKDSTYIKTIKGRLNDLGR